MTTTKLTFEEVKAQIDALPADEYRVDRGYYTLLRAGWTQAEYQRALLDRMPVKRYEGFVYDENLPVQPGQTVTIPKGSIVHTLHYGPRMVPRTYKIRVNHLLNGSNVYVEYHGRTVPQTNPKVRWPGKGGYWSEIDINDVPEAQ